MKWLVNESNVGRELIDIFQGRSLDFKAVGEDRQKQSTKFYEGPIMGSKRRKV